MADLPPRSKIIVTSRGCCQCLLWLWQPYPVLSWQLAHQLLHRTQVCGTHCNKLATWLWPCHFHTWNLTWASYIDNYTRSCWLNPFLVPVLRTPCDDTRDYWDQLPSILDAEPEPKTGLIRAEQISWSAHPHEDSKLSALNRKSASSTPVLTETDFWVSSKQYAMIRYLACC